MKIFYFVRSIDLVPSCMYNIRMLHHLGYKVIAVLGTSTPTLSAVMERLKIEYHVMEPTPKRNIPEKIAYNLRYKGFAGRIISKMHEKGDISFIGTADTAVALWPMLNKLVTVVCVKELYEEAKLYSVLLARICRGADAVVACEKNRARLMKRYWKLPKLPYVLSNKPFEENEARITEPSTELTRDIVNRLRGKKVILYQGYSVCYPEELANIAKALKKLDIGYTLVLVGNITEETERRIKAEYPDVIAAGHVPSPSHMEITMRADIGIAVYSADRLNNLLCAPNKIYEYAMYGVPMICSDIPGLTETVGISGAGVCADMSDTDSIAEGIKRIHSDMEAYKARAREFCESENNVEKIKKIVEAAANAQQNK